MPLAATRKDDAEVRSSREGKARVLLIGPRPKVRSFLEHPSSFVVQVEGKRDAVTRAEAEDYEVAIVDEDLSESECRALFHILREGCPDLQVILLRTPCSGEENAGEGDGALSLFSALVEIIPYPVYYENADGICLGCNRSFERFLGLPREEIVGERDVIKIPSAGGIAGEEEAGDSRTSTTDEHPEAKVVQLPGGIERVVLFGTARFEYGRGSRGGIIRLLRDVGEPKRTDEGLENAKGELADLIDALPCILVSVDDNGFVRQWNKTAERLLGLSRDEVLGKPFHLLAEKWLENPALDVVRKKSAEKCAVTIDEAPYRRPDGTKGMLNLTVNPLHQGRVPLCGFTLLATDITEQRALEKQLRHAQKLESIGQLAAGIAHEINTPTQYVGDNTRFLEDAFADLLRLLSEYERLFGACRKGDQTKEHLEAVEEVAEEIDLDYLKEEIPKAVRQSLEGIERVTSIVKAMKEFAHPGPVEKQEIDLNRAIASTITVARNEWKYVAEMVTDFDESLPPVPCVAGDITQVVLNLIVNAAAAIGEVVGDGSSEKGTIRVSTKQVGDYVEIRVSDTGTGIPEEIQPRIFDPFFTTKEVGKGSGQGLSLAHSVVVEKHGGEITFETEIGKGTTFIVRLPLVDMGEKKCRERNEFSSSTTK